MDAILEAQKVDVAGVKGHWDKRLTSFQKLIFVKAFREEKVSNSLSIINVIKQVVIFIL